MATEPGTDIYVTPDIAAPTMAMAATTRGVERPPVKNVLAVTLRDVYHATTKSSVTYPARVSMMAKGDTKSNN